MKSNKRGISLIVLVITIIVMIILAGTVIMSLDDSKIFDRAQEAVNKTNIQSIQNIISTAWAKAYMNGAKTDEAYQQYIDRALAENGIEESDYPGYVLSVTTRGAELLDTSFWKQTRTTVTNGVLTLQVGDSIEYDATNGGSITGLTSTEWAVLGANEKGELLIMSTSDIVEDYLIGDEDGDNLEEAQRDWLNAASELDEVCAPYGKGRKATGARSINVEDINKVVGYNPELDNLYDGEIYEYGNEVTYSYNGTTTPAYVASNGLKGNMEYAHSNGFHYYNGTSFEVADLTKTTGTIVKLKHDYYYYYPSGINTFDSESKANAMLFGDNYYWLASRFVGAEAYYANFGIRYVEEGCVDYYYLWGSHGGSGYGEYGVRAVVSLTGDINLTGSSASGWIYQ